MDKPANSFSEEEFQARLGLEPAMMENLRESQKSLARLGMVRNLEEVYYLEVEPTDEEESTDEEE